MGDRLITCPCGQRLKVVAGVKQARCPKCSTVLKLRVKPRGGVASQTRSGNQAQPGSGARPADKAKVSTRSHVDSTRRTSSARLRCPCGKLVLIPSGVKAAKCPKCSKLIRPPSTQRRSALETTIVKQPTTESSASLSTPSDDQFQQSSVRTASRGRSSEKRGGESWRPGWWLPVGIGVGSIALLTTAAWIVFPRFLNAPEAETSAQTDSTGTNADGSNNNNSGSNTQAAGSTSRQESNGDLVRIGTYPPGPRLPGTTEFLERDFIATLPPPISHYVEDVPPDMNMAPQLLEVITPLSGQLAICYPEPTYSETKRAEITRVGTKNQRLINQWASEYESSGKLPDPRELQAFDGLFRDLNRLTYQKRNSFFWLPNMDTTTPHLQAMRDLARLTHIRYLSPRVDSTIEDRITELAAFIRLIKIFERHGVAGYVVGQACRILAYDSIVSDMIHDESLSESSGLQLLAVLDESIAVRDSKQFALAIRSEQVAASRFFYDVEKANGAVETLTAIMSFSGTQSTSASKRQEQLQKIVLSKMTVEQIRNNRDAYNRETELLLEFFHSDGFERSTAVDDYLEKNVQREQERRAWEKDLKQLKNIEDVVQEVTKQTWLTELLLYSHEDMISASVRSLARRRVAIATLALRIASLQNAGDSESLPELFKRLNIKESPIDPYSGEPLKTIQRNGVKLVYSVGSDRTDDRAAAKVTNGSPGDIFFDAAEQ